MKSCCVLLFITFCCVVCSGAALSAQDRQSAIEWLPQVASQSLDNAYHALEIFKQLNEQYTGDTKALCALVHDFRSNDRPTWQQYAHATAINSAVSCGLPVDNAASSALSGLQALGDLESGLFALNVLQRTQPDDAEAVRSALQVCASALIDNFRESDGTFKCRPDGAASVACTGMAFKLLAASKQAGVSVDADLQSAAVALLNSASSSNGLSLPSDTSALHATALFLEGSSALALSGLSAEKLALLGDFAQQSLSQKDAQQLYWAVSALKALSSPGIANPVAAIQTPKTTFAANGGKQPVVIEVFNFMGDKVVDGATVTLSAYEHPARQSKPSVQRHADHFQFDLDTSVAGTTKVTIAATPGARTSSVQLRVEQEQLQLQMGDAQLKITQASGKQTSHTVAARQSMRERVALKAGASLQLSTTMLQDLPGVASSRLYPQQLMLRLTATDGSQAALYLPAARSGKTASWVVTPSVIAEHTGAHRGAFAASIIIGDQLLEQALVWRVATIALAVDDDSDAAPATDAAASSSKHVPKPEIIHMHRAPAKRPPVVISVLFAALAFVPLLVLLAAWSALQINVQALFAKGGGVAAMLMHACIAAFLLLFGWYWRLSYSLASIAVPLLVLSGAMLLIGHHALASLSDVRTAAVQKKQE